jgi:hypothetical protein
MPNLGPVLGFFMGGGGAARKPREQVSYGDIGGLHSRQQAADKQAAAKSGVVHGAAHGAGSQIPAKRLWEQVQDTFRATGTTARRNKDGTFSMGFDFAKDLEPQDFYSEKTGQYRTMGDDFGPTQLLKQFQGSNRGSGGYIAQIPRYSVAETRKTGNKFDKQNFMALGKHSGQKYLSPGSEHMMKRQRNSYGGARSVTRKFL